MAGVASDLICGVQCSTDAASVPTDAVLVTRPFKTSLHRLEITVVVRLLRRCEIAFVNCNYYYCCNL